MKFGNRSKSPYYSGPLTLYPDELDVQYKSGKFYFIGTAVDMWHPNVADDDIAQVLTNCRLSTMMTPAFLEKPTFLFQSKGPERFKRFLGELPDSTWLATTIETDDVELYGDMSRAPSPYARAVEMQRVYASADKPLGCKFLLSVEPVMKWKDLDKFMELLLQVPWDMVSIGADTCGVLTPEQQPSPVQITELATALEESGAKVCVKRNCTNLITDKQYYRGYVTEWIQSGWIMDRKKKTRTRTERQPTFL